MIPWRHPLSILLSLPTFLVSSCVLTEFASAQEQQTIMMIEGNDLGHWKAAPFASDGDVDVQDGTLHTGLGAYLTGVVWDKEPPARDNYEIELEAQKTWGSDFFLGLTIPVGDQYCTWIVGGWGGTAVGISDIGGLSADKNETTRKMSFEMKRWYRFKIRVADERIQCWIDGERIINLDTTGKRLSLRPGPIVDATPLGLASYDTVAEYRNMVWRSLARKPGAKFALAR
ncbi:3-keto-disaccharide hydrolase [Pelagicoccus mobilis]|uniref:DUF1080 domain-containing protein n=1 Tax=Pelagicoccus mobilis TaxID=415221 RepID=A0A934VQW5_9BACT|nr:DUF1080 domain-containing protein [Pelagicoccus mobilis]MBK1878767.1 DUF1080 domain-containing protein [Pelagicoccus mobilis]